MSKSLQATKFPDEYLSEFLPGARLNYSRIADQRLTQMVEQNRATLDRDIRVQQFRGISRYVETEVAAPIYGIAYWTPGAIRNTTHNYHPSQFGGGKWWAVPARCFGLGECAARGCGSSMCGAWVCSAERTVYAGECIDSVASSLRALRARDQPRVGVAVSSGQFQRFRSPGGMTEPSTSFVCSALRLRLVRQ